MEKQLNVNLRVLFVLVLAGTLLAAGVVGWSVVTGALPPYKSTSPAATPDPADLPELTSRVNKLENDMQFTLRDIAWRMDQKLLIVSWGALGISAIAAILGVQSLNDLRKMAKEKLQEAFDEAVYAVNPANIPVFLPVNKNMDVIQRRLQLSGFKKVTYYTDLDHIPEQGVVVVSINSTKKTDTEREAEITKLEAQFRSVIKKNKFDPARTAFIIYTTGKISGETLNCYENLVTANMPPTVANMVLVVGRGLINEEKK